MEPTSKSLVDRVRAGTDPEPWRQLASIYTPLLEKWLRRYEIQPNDADDLIQEVLAVVAREVSAFEHTGRQGAFRNWLKTILINRLRHFWRSRKKWPRVSDGTDFRQHLEQLEDARSDLARIWELEHDRFVLGRLWLIVQPRFHKNTCRAFQRHVMEGVSPDDVAAELGMTVNAVLIAKSRVLKELRREGQELLEEME